MTKTVLAAMAAFVALSVPSFASVTHMSGNAIYQQDDSDYPASSEESNPMTPSEDSNEAD